MKKIYTPEIINFIRRNAKGRSRKELTSTVNTRFGLSFTETQIKTAKYMSGLKGVSLYKGKLTLDQRKFLEENIRGRAFAELTGMFNGRFKTGFTVGQIKGFSITNRLKNGIPRVKGGHYWAQEELSFLKNHAKENANKELTVLFNNAFNLSLTRRQIKYACNYNKIKTREQTPVKCTEEIAAFIKKNPEETASNMTVMINRTFGTAFTKKQVTGFIGYYKYKTYYKNDTNEAPLGSERIKRMGRIFVKVSMGGPYNQRWKEKHLWIWEQANGKIPEGYNVIFLDNNPLNCALENLFMLSKGETFVLTLSGLRSNNRDVTHAGIAVAKHQLAINSALKKEMGDKEFRRYVGRKSARKNANRPRRRRNKPYR